MENKIEDLSDSRSGVRISLTRASVSEVEDEDDLAYMNQLDREDKSRSRSDTGSMESSDDNKIAEEDESGQLDDSEDDEVRDILRSKDKKQRNSTGRSEDDSLAEDLQNGVTISDDTGHGKGFVNGDRDNSLKSDNEQRSSGKSPALEMVGDRVLIERDGKFELVDASEIKAEYFEMLGLSKDNMNNTEAESSEKDSEKDSVTTDDKSSTISHERETLVSKSSAKQRPKTSGWQQTSRNYASSRSKSPNRIQSAKTSQRSDEYSYIKSRYAMTEQQMEIKRKREEAIARRRKEEEEREFEEEKRKRDDAERAFEAWLMAKNEEAREQRREVEKNKPNPNIPAQKAKHAQGAYDEWVRSKRQQTKSERELEKSRMEEEATQYLIRDRELCDQAFKKWIRNKCAHSRMRASAKKKKKSPKLKKKEPLPLNSDNIRFYENYGYRNTVVLTP